MYFILSVVVGSNLAHCSFEQTKEIQLTDWDEKTDIIVIGGGLAGLAAAIGAAHAGAAVIDIVKMKVSGGIHAASRLGSCSLTECLVFGRIAGQSAAAIKPRT